MIAACGAFVAAEFAFVTVDRSSVERAAEDGDSRARGVLEALRSLSTQLSAAQVGITVTSQERDARSVLLPIEALETVEPDVTPHQLEQVAARTGFSRYPVCRGGRLVGYLHLKDVLEFEDVHRNRPIARSWIRGLPTVAIDDRLRAILRTTQRSGAHLARVEDGVGSALGVVALEDVLEELVGEIRDEATAATTATSTA